MTKYKAIEAIHRGTVTNATVGVVEGKEIVKGANGNNLNDLERLNINIDGLNENSLKDAKTSYNNLLAVIKLSENLSIKKDFLEVEIKEVVIMYIATCIDKFRDNNGNIFGYRLQIGDIKQFDIEAKKLKREILRNTINVTNLKLTSDGRLVGKTDCTKLVSSVKNKRPYDAESYLEFFNLLVPFMEKALKFKEDDLGGEIRSVNINPDTEILEKFRTALGDVVRFSGVECCTELEFVFTVNNKRGYFLIALTDFSSNKRIYIEQCEISRVNMKSDFKNMLKACEKYRNYYLDTVVK